MDVKIKETSICCVTCNRPLNPDNGPKEASVAVMQATNRRNSLMAREVVLKDLQANKRLGVAQAVELNEVQSELSEINEFLMVHGPWWIRE